MENLVIKNKTKIFIINYCEIISLNSYGRYTTVMTEKNKYTICKNLGLLEKELPAYFYRIHYSHIINIYMVLRIEGTIIIMSNGQTYKIANGRKKETINYITDFVRSSK